MNSSARYALPRHAARAAVVLGAASSAVSLAQSEPARLEMRMMPQTGALPDCLVNDTALPPHVIQGVPKRIVVQWRILDLDLTDGVVPAGLTAMVFDIRVDPSAGALGRALLSRFEAVQTSAVPPGSADCSGNSNAEFCCPTGLQRPFRGSIPAPAPNNNHPANGTLAAGAINGITPLCLSQTDQNAPNAWYNVCGFTFTPAFGFVGNATITVSPVSDPTTHNIFAFFSDGDPAPHTSGAAIGGSLTLVVEAPTTTMCCVGTACTIVSSPSACASMRGRGTPGAICQPGGCCLGDFNFDHHVGVQDLFDFVAAYFVGDPSADVFQTNLGMITLDDLYTFLNSYFHGCP